MKNKFSKSIVIDANAFIKIFHCENDSQNTFDLLTYCIENDILIVAPHFFEYEIKTVCKHLNVDIDMVSQVLGEFRSVNLLLEEPTEDDLKLSAYIVQEHKTQESDFPTAYDAIYKAMSINRNAYFITTEERFKK